MYFRVQLSIINREVVIKSSKKEKDNLKRIVNSEEQKHTQTKQWSYLHFIELMVVC